jgi:hypothetical protein
MSGLSSATRDKLKTVSTSTLMSCLYKRGLRNQFIQDVRPLNPATDEQTLKDFAAWRKAKGR